MPSIITPTPPNGQNCPILRSKTFTHILVTLNLSYLFAVEVDETSEQTYKKQ